MDAQHGHGGVVRCGVALLPVFVVATCKLEAVTGMILAGHAGGDTGSYGAVSLLDGMVVR
jgi:hypothetical protein